MSDTKLKEFISDYFEMTGRPVATMTVDEFYQFSRAFRTLRTENFYSLTDVPQSTIPFQKTESSFDKTDNFPIDSKKETSLFPMTEDSVTEEKNVKKNEGKKPSKEDMLKLMHSVSS